MKHLLRIFLSSAISLVGLMKLHAQEWEQVGWQGGEIQIQAQLGNTLYGASGDAFYKSTDVGKTWSMFRAGLPLNSFTFRISLNLEEALRTDNKYLYLNNGGYHEPGVYFCSENDASWSFRKYSLINGSYPSTSPLRTFSISQDSILTYYHKYSYQSDSSDGFYLSIDNGITWKLHATVLTTSNYVQLARLKKRIFMEIAMYDTSKKTYRNKILKSDNLGLTWDTLITPWSNSSDANLYVLSDSILFAQILGNNPGDSSQSLFKSIDRGVTWDIPKGPLPSKYDTWDIDFLKVIGKKLFMFVEDLSKPDRYRLYSSNDLGDDWRRILLPDTNMQLPDIFGIDNNYILSYLKDQIAYFSTDSTFEKLTRVYFNQALSNAGNLLYVSGANLYGSFISSSGSYPGVLYTDSILTSPDNGITWTPKLFLANNRLNGLNWLEDGLNLYATGKEKINQHACIYKSTDKGTSWAISSTLSLSSDISQFYIHRDTIIVKLDSANYSAPSQLWVSIDGGKSWVVLSTPFVNYGIDYFGMSVQDGSILLSSNQYFFSSADLGLSWRQLTYQNFPGGYESGMYLVGNKNFFNTINESLHYIYKSYYTVDSGFHWTKCAGLDTNMICIPSKFRDGVFYSVCYSPDDHNPYNEGRNALFYSRDTGNSWYQLGSYFTNATDFFSGSEYYFMAGSAELWRLPKSALSVKPPQQKNISSLSMNCFPNPATTSTRISYSIPKRSDVLVQAFDVMGREVARIASGTKDVGSYDAVWDTKLLPAGSYIIRLSAGGESAAKVVEVVR